MPCYIVSYDLHSQGQNYSCLNEKLKGYGTYWHMQGSVWLISTSQSAVQVRDNLQSCLDSNDKLFVARLNGEAAWKGYSAEGSDWLRKQLNS